MQVSVETTSGLERRLTITIPAEKIEAEFDKRVQKAAPNLHINGFRKGKVPVKVVRQRYGSGIRQEVLSDMMSSSFQDAVTQEKLKPAGQPKIEMKEAAGKDFSFMAIFEVYPEIALKDLEGVEVFNPVTEINDSDIDAMIESLQKRDAEYVEVDRAAKLDDEVNIDYQGTRNGEAFDGGTAKDTDLVLGSKTMILGFEDGIVGLAKGDEKTLNLVFPEDYSVEDLKGAAVEFVVKVNSVSEQHLPEIDEKFLEKAGITEGGVDALRVKVKSNMEKELKNALKARLKDQVFDAVLEKNVIDVPLPLIEQEIDQMRRQMVQQFTQGKGMDDFDLSLLPADLFKERAEKRVRLGLVLTKALEHYEVKASADEVRAAVEDIASAYDASSEVIDWYYNNEQQLAQVEAMVLEDSIMSIFLESANKVDESLTYEDLLSKVNAQAQY